MLLIKPTMKLLMLIFISVLAISCCNAQELDWKSAGNWRLYEVRGNKAFRIQADSLRFFGSIALDSATMQHYLQYLSIWPAEKTSVWMGQYTASCETKDQKLHKVIISNYGGFIYDTFNRRYYEIPKEQRANWMAYINSMAEKLGSNK
jgi:hypothetical protein